MREKSMNVGNVVQEVVGDPVRHYQTHYEHLDALRRRRDTQLATVQKTQDKLDKLKLKVCLTNYNFTVVEQNTVALWMTK